MDRQEIVTEGSTYVSPKTGRVWEITVSYNRQILLEWFAYLINKYDLTS